MHVDQPWHRDMDCACKSAMASGRGLVLSCDQGGSRDTVNIAFNLEYMCPGQRWITDVIPATHSDIKYLTLVIIS